MRAKINRPMTLKLKFTLLTIFIMVITGLVLVVTINYDIQRTLAKVSDGVIVEGLPNFGTSIEPDMPQVIVPDVIIRDEGHSSALEFALNSAATTIYTTSVVAFMVIMLLGGISAYFIVRHALHPLEQLNTVIKEMNENNLNYSLDISGPKNEINELAISFNKMLAKLNQAFSSQKRFNSSIAHELKTPLAIIHTNIDILENSPASLEEYQATFLTIKKSIVKMDLMVESLLDLVRQENDPLNEWVSLNEVISDAAQDLKPLASKRDITIEVFCKQLTTSIKGNQILLYRAIYNLIENAIKYNKNNGSIIVKATEDKESIFIEISDTGIGIDNTNLIKIFEPFFRCKGTNLSSTDGLGLGLSLVKSAVELHGGTIQVLSEREKGTQFYIKFPKPLISESKVSG